MLSQEHLKEVLNYDESTGVFTWLVKRNRKVAGSLKPSGYSFIYIGDRWYRAHRLAWLYVFGKWPKKEMDHKNGNKNDNRLINLREADRSTNMQNKHKAHNNNVSGFLGVQYRNDKNKKQWRAELQINGVRKHLGCFATPEEAYYIYMEAKKTLHNGYHICK